MQVLFTSDFSFSKNSKKLTQNAYFVVGFQKFLDHALLLPKCDAPIFGQWKDSWRYIIVVSLIQIAFVVAKLLICKCFRGTRKVDFRLLLGGFLGITLPNAVGLSWNLDQWCSAKQSIICNSFFYLVLKIPRKEAKKPFFWLFSEVFPPRPSMPYGPRPNFLPSERSHEDNRGKFHHDNVCSSKVINFQMFSWRCSSHEMDLFWPFLGPFSPKYGSNLLKFGP